MLILWHWVLGVQDTKAASEIAALKDWYTMLANDSSRAFYGPGHVFAAHELGAIGTLLLSDTLFRVNDIAKVGVALTAVSAQPNVILILLHSS